MSELTLEGSMALVKPAWHHLSPGSDHAAGTPSDLAASKLMKRYLPAMRRQGQQNEESVFDLPLQ